jgi:hypothetical protein
MIEADSNRRFVILQGGLVVNVAMSAAPLGPEWVESKEGEIGDLSDGKTFVKPEPIPSRIQQEAEDAIQNLLDNTAKAHGYDSMLSLCSYAESSFAKWAAEGTCGRQWRDACWQAAQDIQDAVLAGKRALPTVGEVIAAMPEVKWPA